FPYTTLFRSSTQSIDEDGRALLSTDVADNAAHDACSFSAAAERRRDQLYNERRREAPPLAAYSAAAAGLLPPSLAFGPDDGWDGCVAGGLTAGPCCPAGGAFLLVSDLTTSLPFVS